MTRRLLLSLAFLSLLAGGARLAAQAPTTPSPDTAAYQQATDKAKVGDFKGAIAVLEPLRKAGTASPRTLSLLGTLYVESGRAKEALSILQPLADAPDAEAAVLYNAGRAALASGDAASGQRYLERSVAKANDSPAVRDLGLLYARQGKLVEAYALLRRWVPENPQDAEPRLTAALMALRLERLDEADALLRGFASQDPAIALLHGEIANARGDGKAALAFLEPIRQRHPAGMEPELRRALGEAYLLAGQPAAALRVLSEKPSSSPVMSVLLARAQRLTGDLAAAQRTLQPLVERLPQSPQDLPDPRSAANVALEYAQVLRAGPGGDATAVPYFERATLLNPLSHDAWRELAASYDRLGRAQDAARARQRLAELEPPRKN